MFFPFMGIAATWTSGVFSQMSDPQPDERACTHPFVYESRDENSRDAFADA